jgi:tetratricopeptide (TPR) repeat protein
MLSFGQDYQKQFAEFCEKKDTLAQRKLLEEWKQSNPNDPELFTSYFNYYFFLSKHEILGLETKPNNGESLTLLDSNNQAVAFIVGNTFYDETLLNKAYEVIDKGIEKFPTRLDMRFGKIYALGQNENWIEFSKEIIKTIHYSDKVKNNWTWTNNEAVKDAETMFLDGIQGYLNQLYSTEDDSLLKPMREISEIVLIYHPKHVESLSNIAITYLLTKNYKQGLKYLLKAEKINPEDAIVLNNIAYAYKALENKKKAIKYYKKTIKYGNNNEIESAKQQINLLEKE